MASIGSYRRHCENVAYFLEDSLCAVYAAPNHLNLLGHLSGVSAGRTTGVRCGRANGPGPVMELEAGPRYGANERTLEAGPDDAENKKDPVSWAWTN
jgi:hypothetical protein